MAYVLRTSQENSRNYSKLTDCWANLKAKVIFIEYWYVRTLIFIWLLQFWWTAIANNEFFYFYNCVFQSYNEYKMLCLFGAQIRFLSLTSQLICETKLFIYYVFSFSSHKIGTLQVIVFLESIILKLKVKLKNHKMLF